MIETLSIVIGVVIGVVISSPFLFHIIIVGGMVSLLVMIGYFIFLKVNKVLK